MKFQELKLLKEAQNRMIVKSVLEQQMEQDRRKKLNSREARRDAMGGEATFGPKETKETILYQMLKKQQDAQKIREDLETQIMAKSMDKSMGHQK